MILAFDSSAAHCAAAVLRGDDVLSVRAVDMARGQAEALMPLLQDVMDEAGCGFSDLTRIGVGIGPGNFTGIRISVSAARGLALGLGIPAVGVTTLDALRGGVRGVAAVQAPRQQAYVQVDDAAPGLLALTDVPDDAVMVQDPGDLAVAIGRLAAQRAAGTPPAPFYLRAADAAPSSEPPVVILDDA